MMSPTIKMLYIDILWSHHHINPNSTPKRRSIVLSSGVVWNLGPPLPEDIFWLTYRVFQ